MTPALPIDDPFRVCPHPIRSSFSFAPVSIVLTPAIPIPVTVPYCRCYCYMYRDAAGPRSAPPFVAPSARASPGESAPILHCQRPGVRKSERNVVGQLSSVWQGGGDAGSSHAQGARTRHASRRVSTQRREREKKRRRVAREKEREKKYYIYIEIDIRHDTRTRERKREESSLSLLHMSQSD